MRARACVLSRQSKNWNGVRSSEPAPIAGGKGGSGLGWGRKALGLSSTLRGADQTGSGRDQVISSALNMCPVLHVCAFCSSHKLCAEEEALERDRNASKYWRQKPRNPELGRAPCSPHRPEGHSQQSMPLWPHDGPRAQSALEMTGLELITHHRPLHTGLVKTHRTCCGSKLPLPQMGDRQSSGPRETPVRQTHPEHQSGLGAFPEQTPAPWKGQSCPSP